MHIVHNARLQLVATALNNLGVGCILTGIVAPVINGTIGDIAHIVLWCALGVNFVALAQYVLGRLR